MLKKKKLFFKKKIISFQTPTGEKCNDLILHFDSYYSKVDTKSIQKSDYL
jgi:hypothetical protein